MFQNLGSSGSGLFRKNLNFTFSLDTPSMSSGTLDKYLMSVLGQEPGNGEKSLESTDVPTKKMKAEALNETPSSTYGTASVTSSSTSNINNHTHASNNGNNNNNNNNNDNNPNPNARQAPTASPSTSSSSGNRNMSYYPSEFSSTRGMYSDNTASSFGPLPSLPSFSENSGGSSSFSRNQHSEGAVTPAYSGGSRSGDNLMSTADNQLVTTNASNQLANSNTNATWIDITEYLSIPQAEAARRLNIPPSTLSKRWKEAVAKQRKWPYRMVCKIDKEIMTLLHNVPQGPNAPPLPQEIENELGNLLRKRQEELRPVIIRL